MGSHIPPLLLLLLFGLTDAARHLGAELGPLTELHHGLRGRVYAVDSRTLYVTNLHYDGEGPAAYFYVGVGNAPSATGAMRVRDERGRTAPLRRYRGENVTLSLPEGKSLADVDWFFVWCDDFSVSFGEVKIPRGLDFPKPARIGALRGVHAVRSDPIVVVDAQTLLIPNFSYDGEAPDAKFWVGRGKNPSPEGIRIPDENGKEVPLRKYDNKTIVLTLPGELTVFDIGHFAIWCEAFTVNFGHVVVPQQKVANVPPSLKMLGVSPQSRNEALVKGVVPPPAVQESSPRAPPRHGAIAKVDATTYRPASISPDLLAALAEKSSDHNAHLHRRADNYAPASAQLIIDEEAQRQQHHFNQEPHYQKDYHDEQRDYLAQQQLHQQLLEEEQLYQQRLYEQQRAYEQQRSYDQQRAYDQQRTYDQQRAYDQQREYEQQRAYDQQRAYEQQLLQRANEQVDDRYRLVPYHYEEKEDNGALSGVGVSIQRSIDLDPVSGAVRGTGGR